MHRDEYGDDPFIEEDETDVAYDDGFAEAFALGEADYISSSKRHEKDRRAAVRRDTGKVVVGSARRHIDRSTRRYRAQNDAAELVRQQWEKRYKSIIFDIWQRTFQRRPDSIVLRIVLSAMVSRAVAIATEKLRDANSPEDVILVPVRALLASGLAAARREGKITPEQQEALTRNWYEGFDAVEKVIKIIIKGGSGESEDWEVASDPLDDLEAIASVDEDEFSWEASPAGNRGRARAAPGASNGASPSDRRLAAEALRRCAKYLLRMERRLIEAGR